MDDKRPRHLWVRDQTSYKENYLDFSTLVSLVTSQRWSVSGT